MSEHSAEPFDFLQIQKDFFAAQQKFLPSGQILERVTEASRGILQAQMNYGQALMRANAALLSAFFETPAARAAELGPCAAARQPEYANS